MIRVVFAPDPTNDDVTDGGVCIERQFSAQQSPRAPHDRVPQKLNEAQTATANAKSARGVSSSPANESTSVQAKPGAKLVTTLRELVRLAVRSHGRCALPPCLK